MRVAVLDDIHQAYAQQPAIQRLRQRVDVHIFTEAFGEPEALRGFEAVIANRERTRFDRALLERLPDLKIIVQTGAHAYHVDFEAARELGIIVAQARSGSGTDAAELTIGLILALMRHIAAADVAMKRGAWPAPLGIALSWKTLGIVGLDSVGRAVARMAAAFDMCLLAWSRSLTAERSEESGAELRSLEALLAESDVVTVQVALSPASRNLIGDRELGQMRPHAYLINTSRGPIVSEAALITALRSGVIAGVGLNVYDQESLPIDYPYGRCRM